MPSTPTPSRYNPLMMLLHWAMALGLAVAFGMGLYMVDIPGITPFKLKLFNWHKWLGVSLFALLMIRILVRAGSTLPSYPASWAGRLMVLVKSGHWALYAMMLITPVLGYLYSLAAGYPVVWFGVIELPVIIHKDPALKEVFEELHELSAWGLVILVAGHVLMAVKHEWMDNTRILGKMIPGLRVDKQ
ncbi:cytochrome b [Limnobacter humi]|uniref:Cytochrome b n=1 Tax=Limnobacter humi TaxID=1778671 RepID=A0ABT1WFJ8_9BURK|nr:cytochrome b [Limnobacter humi]MCQ8895673.1 cytochrome b [Limnobacter humi]